MTDLETPTVFAQIAARRSQTLTSIVREAIEDMIISGELAEGDRVNESALAARLQVSRGPIREAVRGLDQAGLLRNVTNQGAFVRELSLEEIRDLYDIRVALGGLVGRLFVERATDADMDALSALVAAMDEVAHADDVDRYYKLNIEFHDHLVAGTRNDALYDMYQTIIKRLHIARRRGLIRRGNLHVSNAEHALIIRAAKRRDAAGAAEAISTHIANGWKRFAKQT